MAAHSLFAYQGYGLQHIYLIPLKNGKCEQLVVRPGGKGTFFANGQTIVPKI